jgi:DNA recombination protein RmuC
VRHRSTRLINRTKPTNSAQLSEVPRFAASIMITMEWLIGIVIGLLAGAAVAAAWLGMRKAASQSEIASLRARAQLLDQQIQTHATENQRMRDELNAVQHKREAAERLAAVTSEQLSAKQKQFEEQRQLLADAEKKLSDSFAALGAKALQVNNEQFMTLAKKTFEALMTEAKGDVEKKQQAIDNLIKPIKELLEKQNTAVGEIEKKRETAYVRLDEQIKAISIAHEKLGSETTKLVKALRRPEQRGRWGEMQLRNAVEMAGMTEHCDFAEQVTLEGSEGVLRPDMIVKLPGGGVIMVDAKVAIDAYLDALENENDRAALLQRHASQVETHCRGLSKKGYWQLDRTPKVVVMFMPLESALIAALEVNPELQSDAMKQNVLIATPTLLVAMLRAVAYGWQQDALARNADEIKKVGGELYERMKKFVESLESVGDKIGAAASAYNKTIGSLEARVLPSARKLKELHATTDAEIDSPPAIEIEVRPIIAPELRALGSNPQ